MNEEIITLDRLKKGQKGRVVRLENNPALKRRLNDIGLICGTDIECKIISPFCDPKAYIICGALIALRNCDARQIGIVLI